MSMIGNTLLHEIVNQKHIYDTDIILAELNKGVMDGLRQSETNNDDGMDISLCCLQQGAGDQIIVTFSGAKRPLYCYQGGDKEVMIVKGDRKSVGGVHVSTREFTKQVLTLRQGDAIYLFSDGLTDQNNQDRKKLGTENLKQFIVENGTLSMSEQKAKLEQTLADHMGNCEQRDDILFIGVRV
jgi:serine phosphatase RsbU (regulator of sigma subunit)